MNNQNFFVKLIINYVVHHAYVKYNIKKKVNIIIVKFILQKNIKEEKKSKFNENIKILEDLSKTFQNSNNELIKIIEKINENKDTLKLNIQKIFTNIRNAINQREDELLLEVDKQFDDLYIKEDIIKENEKIPSKVKLALEKGKNLEKEWNNENNLIYLINDCIYIENTIQSINKINENIKKCHNLNNLNIIFYPDKENDINQFLEKIKSFGKICENQEKETEFIFNNSLIIQNNKLYDNNLINWLKPKKINKVELLFRKSRDGDSYDIFHKLCDNQGPTVVLIKCTEGFIFGGFTPLDWDNHSGWKKDKETFLFSLTDNKKFIKNKTSDSILCFDTMGPFFEYIGFRKKNLSKGDYQYGLGNYFENYSEIIPNGNKDRDFDTEEVEVLKIIFE